MAGRPSGRRPGDSGTREAILAAARRLFAEQGFDRTTIRQVAGAADVDPTLVHHYYGSKQRLFVAVVELPFEPDHVVAHVLTGDPAGVGERLARFVVGALEAEESRRRLLGLIRAAASEPEAAAMLRTRLTDDLLSRVATGIGADRPEYRATLCASQMIGIAMARYVVAVEPLASASAARLVADVAPTLQRYLTGSLSPSG
ncbi:TetR/AcrR family transcriptional regulator [Aquipuribacter sp. SD81]|uniref:TetR/AcrR family transcriptional regulator n=1 Tax=Aquipuribacter sp. SD81 TaxID=3127703 RepID=UPI00301ACEED